MGIHPLEPVNKQELSRACNHNFFTPLASLKPAVAKTGIASLLISSDIICLLRNSVDYSVGFIIE